jgi:hypothetical protein
VAAHLRTLTAYAELALEHLWRTWGRKASLLLFVFLGCAQGGASFSADQDQLEFRLREVIIQNRTAISSRDVAAVKQQLEPFGEAGTPLLIKLATTKWDGTDYAARTLLVMDMEAHGRLLFSLMPSLDRTVWGELMTVFFIEKIRNPEFPFSQELYKEAISTFHGPGPYYVCDDLIVRTIAHTGSSKDIQLLEKCPGTPVVVGSLARLGSEKHLAKIRQLLAIVPKKLTWKRYDELLKPLEAARVSGRRELVPVLCRYIYIPAIADHDMVGDTAIVAMDALEAILRDGRFPEPKFWYAECEKYGVKRQRR